MHPAVAQRRHWITSATAISHAHLLLFFIYFNVYHRFPRMYNDNCNIVITVIGEILCKNKIVFCYRSAILSSNENCDAIMKIHTNSESYCNRNFCQIWQYDFLFFYLPYRSALPHTHLETILGETLIITYAIWWRDFYPKRQHRTLVTASPVRTCNRMIR